MLVAIKYNSTQIAKTVSLSSPRNNLAVTVRPGKGREKSIKNKGDKKRGKKSLLLLLEKVCIFLKNKNKFPESNLFQEK